MTDTALRSRARRDAATHAPTDRAAHLRARVRAGHPLTRREEAELLAVEDRGRLALAAWAGDPAARAVLGVTREVPGAFAVVGGACAWGVQAFLEATQAATDDARGLARVRKHLRAGDLARAVEVAQRLAEGEALSRVGDVRGQVGTWGDEDSIITTADLQAEEARVTAEDRAAEQRAAAAVRARLIALAYDGALGTPAWRLDGIERLLLDPRAEGARLRQSGLARERLHLAALLADRGACAALGEMAPAAPRFSEWWGSFRGDLPTLTFVLARAIVQQLMPAAGAPVDPALETALAVADARARGAVTSADDVSRAAEGLAARRPSRRARLDLVATLALRVALAPGRRAPSLGAELRRLLEQTKLDDTCRLVAELDLPALLVREPAAAAPSPQRAWRGSIEEGQLEALQALGRFVPEALAAELKHVAKAKLRELEKHEARSLLGRLREARLAQLEAAAPGWVRPGMGGPAALIKTLEARLRGSKRGSKVLATAVARGPGDTSGGCSKKQRKTIDDLALHVSARGLLPAVLRELGADDPADLGEAKATTVIERLQDARVAFLEARVQLTSAERRKLDRSSREERIALLGTWSDRRAR